MSNRPRVAELALVLVLVLAAPAGANAPAAQRLDLAVRAGGTGPKLGTVATRLAYAKTGAQDSGTVNVTSSDITLAGGYRYLLTSCASAHGYARAPDTHCAQRTVDLSARTSSSKAKITGTSRTVLRRPSGSTGPQSFVHGYLEIRRQRAGDTSWGGIWATIWPASGLAGAAIGVAAQAATSAPAPGRQGVVLDGLGSGGINNGLPDSVCWAPGSASAQPSTTEPGTSRTALGSMPAYYEVGEPTTSGKPAVGVMLVMHGGGWYANGGGGVAAMRADSLRWRARGWRTVNHSYRGCGLSVTDAIAFAEQAAAAHPGLPICATGSSAGGHLALVVAARASLRCAISLAGPTGLAALAGQSAPTADGAGTQTSGPRAAHNLAVAAFGQENLASVSPVSLPSPARVLMAVGERDHLVPWAQATAIASALRARDPGAYVDIVRLPFGDRPFVHTPVTQGSLDDLYAREQQLVAPLVGGP